MNKTRRAIMAVVLGIMPLNASAAETTWVTTAPTEGSEAVGYEWEYRLAEDEPWVSIGTTDETFVVIEQPANVEFFVRVRAWDAEGHYGPWSEVGQDVYAAPGACGKPERSE